MNYAGTDFKDQNVDVFARFYKYNVTANVDLVHTVMQFVNSTILKFK